MGDTMTMMVLNNGEAVETVIDKDKAAEIVEKFPNINYFTVPTQEM